MSYRIEVEPLGGDQFAIKLNSRIVERVTGFLNADRAAARLEREMLASQPVTQADAAMVADINAAPDRTYEH